MVVVAVAEEQKRKGRVFLQAIGVRSMPSHTWTRRVRACRALWPLEGHMGGMASFRGTRIRFERGRGRQTVFCSLPRVHDKCSTLPRMVRGTSWTRRGGTDVQSRHWLRGALVGTETCSVGETLS